jgi:ABC-type uncharacterized transport system substrate-binding protein
LNQACAFAPGLESMLLGILSENPFSTASIKTELVINLQTANALGIDMPLSLLLRVTETIE